MHAKFALHVRIEVREPLREQPQPERDVGHAVEVAAAPAEKQAVLELHVGAAKEHGAGLADEVDAVHQHQVS